MQQNCERRTEGKNGWHSLYMNSISWCVLKFCLRFIYEFLILKKFRLCAGSRDIDESMLCTLCTRTIYQYIRAVNLKTGTFKIQNESAIVDIINKI